MPNANQSPEQGTQEKATKPFSLLIKPASADCNLRCDYCFYLENKALYPRTAKPRMSREVLSRLMRSYLDTPQPVHSMIWQGGEPTLMGRSFFEGVIAAQKRHAPKGTRLANSIQTNAVGISEEMAELFARYRFLAGCSLDGPPEVHDRYRRTRLGRPTQERVFQGISVLSRQGVPVNALVLVSRANVDQPLSLYRYLKDRGFTHIQFIPCVEFDDRGNPLPFTITGEEWGEFLRVLFEEWHARDVTTISIRHFESVLSKLVYGTASECCFGASCDSYFAVEHNGDIYPCDFFVRPSYFLGNIASTSWLQAQNSETYSEFSAMKSQWNSACDRCAHQSLCMGDCLKHRMIRGKSPDRLSWLCSGWKRFFETSRKRFEALARTLTTNTPP
ncbi:MAG: anaerobic sulfatase maturase [Desulfohalobiaceae bacterium]|nr:anaerobic sulfatase maturase [Desulfohalobiaceae bacterium]